MVPALPYNYMILKMNLFLSIEAFYTGLEKIVSSSKAHVFKLIVLSDSQKSKTRKPKVFSNDHIEKVSEPAVDQ